MRALTCSDRHHPARIETGGRGRMAAEDGFGVAESVVALAIVAAIFLGLAASLGAGLRGVHDARLHQQATALSNEAIDGARDLDYDDIAMRDGDLTGDPNVLTGNRFDPDAGGALASEPLVSTAGGGQIDPHVTTQAVQGIAFTVSRYVTWVDEDSQGGAGQDYKRLTTLVRWTARGVDREYRSSTFITQSRAGLPVPKFELTPSTFEVSVEPGNQVVLAHTIRNLGIVDAYDVALSVPLARGWSPQFYVDTDEDGQYDAGLDTLMTDTNASGAVDTGNVVTNDTVYVLAVWTLSFSEPPGSEALILTATSGASSDVEHTAEETVTVGGAGLELFLHNASSPPTGNTTAKSNMPMDETAPSAATLHKYSTDYYSGSATGRYLDKRNISASESDKKYMANWVYQLGEDTTFDGDATLRFWAAGKDFNCSQVPQYRVYLRWKNSKTTTSGTTIASATVSSPASCSHRVVEVTLPMDLTVAVNKWLEVKIGVQDASGDAAVVGYDTVTYDASIDLPRVTT